MTTTATRPLTKAQIKYASERIYTIQSEKIDAFKATLPKVPDAPEKKEYTHKQKIAFIKAGKATLKNDYYVYNYLTSAFDYPVPKLSAADQKKFDTNKKVSKANKDAIAKFTAVLSKRVTMLLDQLHLGDSQSTLALVESFAAEK